jgi:hypothetical protein
MEQRPLRLGDIVDDYCPRERRITNHAIVAIVEDAIRQTRCSTCDADHVYKQGKEPLRRRREAPPAVGEAAGSPESPASAAPPAPTPAPVVPIPATVPAPPQAVLVASPGTSAREGADARDATDRSDATGQSDPSGQPDAATDPAPAHDDHWPAHRQLIRASLPKIEGELPAPRPIPEFTMHQRPSGRGGQGFRFSHGRQGDGNGNVAGRGDFNGHRGPGRGSGSGGGGGNGNQAGGPGRAGRRRGHGKRPR